MNKSVIQIEVLIWTPLHHASRGGHHIEYLITEQGCCDPTIFIGTFPGGHMNKMNLS